MQCCENGHTVPDRLEIPEAGPVLILTPTGRDAEGAANLLAAERIESRIYPTLDSLESALDNTAGAVLLADEALFRADLNPVATLLSAQPPWSDVPFIVLTQAGITARRQMAELNLPSRLGNVLFLERPLNALGLVSAVKSTLRARQRQRQVGAYLAEQVGAAERVAALLEARVQERTAALEAAERERQKIAEALAQSQKMEAVGQLTGGLAHDFNNLLAGISGCLELLQTRLAQGRIEQLGRYIGMAQQGAQCAAVLTQRLLAFSRRQALDPKPIHLNKLVAGLSDLISSTVGPAIAIEIRREEELWLTLCDSHQLENVLLNLCINARDAMPQGGRLTIRTANTWLSPTEAALLREAGPGEYVVLSVADTGCGMTPEVLARAFDPFFTTKPPGEGTGLGLSMTYGFVQQSGGHVQISSAVGQGTTVRIYLPRHDSTEDDDDDADEPTAMVRAKVRTTVLVVDDEPPVRMLISEALTDLGYAVQEASDGRSGLQLLRANTRIDLLITDVGMPGGMNGRQLAEAAREQRPDLKILFISGYAAQALSRDGPLGSGTQIMTKPFAMTDLAAKVHTMLADSA
jgi:signal transduction histidine kinase/ActR/RegA family two-component response regulator